MLFPFKFNDGGRANYYKGRTGDCVVRAISIALDLDYKFVYSSMNKFLKMMKAHTPKHNSRMGINRFYHTKFLEQLGWQYLSLSKLGRRYHHLNKLDLSRLPHSVYIIHCEGHLTVIKNGELNDTFDCSRNGKRAVKGIYVKGDIK